ncbi:hypothetical protein AGMMS49990_02400 [Endomicrobiia bacterium]|nr:hypothetical protein AGMMS49990_02400 [Endomicrobiia bacterium]
MDNLGDNLGEIVLKSEHFVYRVNGNDYDNSNKAQTEYSCGIWAVRRKLRHMYHLGTYDILGDAWYRESDKEMRQRIGAVNGKMISGENIILLQTKFGIKEDNAEVHGFDIVCAEEDRWLFKNKELLCVCAPQGEDDYTGHRGGKIRGFDYDFWVRRGEKYRLYCKDLNLIRCSGK